MCQGQRLLLADGPYSEPGLHNASTTGPYLHGCDGTGFERYGLVQSHCDGAAAAEQDFSGHGDHRDSAGAGFGGYENAVDDGLDGSGDGSSWSAHGPMLRRASSGALFDICHVGASSDRCLQTQSLVTMGTP